MLIGAPHLFGHIVESLASNAASPTDNGRPTRRQILVKWLKSSWVKVLPELWFAWFLIKGRNMEWTKSLMGMSYVSAVHGEGFRCLSLPMNHARSQTVPRARRKVLPLMNPSDFSSSCHLSRDCFPVGRYVGNGNSRKHNGCVNRAQRAKNKLRSRARTLTSLPLTGNRWTRQSSQRSPP